MHQRLKHPPLSATVTLLPYHVTLDVSAYGLFKREVINIITTIPHMNGARMPAKSDVAGMARDVWEDCFAPANILASLAGAGIVPIDKERTMNRLNG